MVELLIYSLLLATLLISVYRLYIEVSRQKISQTANAALYQNASRLLFDLQQTLRRATKIDSPIKKQIASELSLNSGAVIYQLANQQLLKIEGDETNRMTDQDVTVEELSFHHLGPSTSSATIKINFTLQSLERRATFQTAVTLP